MWDRQRDCAAGPGSSRGTGTDRAAASDSVSGSVSGPHHSSVPTSLFSSRRRPATAAAVASWKAASANNNFRLVRRNSNPKAYSLSSSRSRSQLDLDFDIDHPLSAFGITTDVTHKYRILNGKTVPQSLYPEDSYTSRRAYPTSPPSSPDLKPPPRNPRRLQQRRYQTAPVRSRTSSLYSADDSDPGHDASSSTIRRGPDALAMAQPLAVEPVSPPSSPEIAAWRAAPHAGNVSPIDEDSDASLDHFVRAIKGNPRGPALPADGLRYSQIHVAQRDLPPAPRQGHFRAQGIDQAPAYQQPPAQRKPVTDENVSWRPQSQPQRNAAGNAAGGLVHKPPQHAMIPERDSSFGLRSKQAGRHAMPLDVRPPWHGASGREKQLSALRDDSNVAPLSLPTKTGKRTAAKGDSRFRARLSHIGSPPAEGASGPGAAMRKLISSRAHKNVSSLATQSPRDQFNMDADQHVSNPYPSPPYQEQNKMTSATPQPQHTIRRKPPPGAHIDRNSNHAHPLASSPVNDNELPKPPTPESPTAPHRARGDALTQPGSRFSKTTYATTIGGVTSIENSPAIGIGPPSLPRFISGGPVSRNEHMRSVSEAPSAMRSAMASRPDSSASNGTARTSGVFAPERGAATPRRASLSSVDKPLPPAPPEVLAHHKNDKLAHLTAQLDGLRNRRLNIKRCVEQMTVLIPMDNLLDSDEVQKKRGSERKKVDALRAELDQVQQEEHEVGLRLHRAYKREDKNAVYEPTTLWVRRVAG
ncbi:hypothetical protein A9K55_002880 [Cordyceps militaris]|uniref:Uncharacterized protein n=1 Tax=Cordyceps militaris TaxID=73501 RepID=A0A2H4S7T3_CORMI|nr:hypothetical protein A9K55_002880 [Cordyceps militaris]